MKHFISPDHFSLSDLADILIHQKTLDLSEISRKRIHDCRVYLESKINGSQSLYYGINTGFGSLCDVHISQEDIAQLQYNLVVSHAAGTGDTVPPEIVKIMLLLKIQSLAYGHSGVRVEVVEQLMALYNHNILPVIFELGSLGASGDLAPLAHLSLPLIGEGEVWYEGRRVAAAQVLKQHQISPIQFEAKEALALLNGTQFSAAYAVWCLLQCERLLQTVELNTAIGYDAFQCRLSPLDANIHRVRPHKGQVTTATVLRQYLEGSALSSLEKVSVQDPYAFRCAPQVHGASRDAIAHVHAMVTTEINSVTDNPNIFPEEDLIVSGGNFHAQPLALPLDYLAIAVSELGNISERRVYQLISGQRGLPPFLTKNPGLHSGMMIAQYTAAAIVNQNKMLCSPASVDSIVSCNGQEDHVSMAANAGTKARKVVQNVQRLLAIERMVATQALSFRRPVLSSAIVEDAVEKYRTVVPVLEEDRQISIDIERTIHFLEQEM